MADKSLISHLGIAVADLDEAIQRFSLLLGREPAMHTEVADQKVRVAMFPGDESNTESGGRIELVAATQPDSPIAKFVEKRGEGLHHVCVYVDDIDAKLAELKNAGVRLIDASPRVGAEGNRIAFVHPSSAHGVLIELEERPDR